MTHADEPQSLSDVIRERALDRAFPDRYKPITPEQITARMESLGQRNRDFREANAERLARYHARQDAETARKNRLAALSGISLDFPTYVAAQPDHPAVAEWVTAALSGSPRWLVLLGPTGVGKTWQAIGAYRALVETTGCDGRVVRAVTLLAQAMPGESSRLNWAALEDVDVLLLDDIPPGVSEWDRRTLMRLIDTRVNRRRLTIITTNLRREQVRSELGEQLASRLSADTWVVEVAGADRRITG